MGPRVAKDTMKIRYRLRPLLHGNIRQEHAEWGPSRPSEVLARAPTTPAPGNRTLNGVIIADFDTPKASKQPLIKNKNLMADQKVGPDIDDTDDRVKAINAHYAANGDR